MAIGIPGGLALAWFFDAHVPDDVSRFVAWVGVVLFALLFVSLAWRAGVVHRNPTFRACLRTQAVVLRLPPEEAIDVARRALLALPDTALEADAKAAGALLARQASTTWRVETRLRIRITAEGDGRSQVLVECWVPFQSVETSFGTCRRNVQRVVSAVLAAASEDRADTPGK